MNLERVVKATSYNITPYRFRLKEGDSMPVRQVTQKRKAKATKGKPSASKTLAIRIMRASFFIVVGFLLVFFYYAYENGVLIELSLIHI